jgi:DNA-binding HxlR family transcriptional regulator
MSIASRKTTSTNFQNETFLTDKCVLNTVTKIIGRRWTSEILLLIEKDVCRFSTIKEKLDGISDNVLSDCLNKLVGVNILEKKIYQQVPLKVEYFLTDNGKSLVNLLHNFCDWGKSHGNLK